MPLSIQHRLLAMPFMHHKNKKDFPNIMMSPTTCDLMDSHIKATHMSQMKLLLKMWRSRGCHFRNTKLTKFFYL